MRRKVCKVRNRARPDPLFSALDGAYAVSIWRDRTTHRKLSTSKPIFLDWSNTAGAWRGTVPTSGYVLSVFRLRYQMGRGQVITEPAAHIFRGTTLTSAFDHLLDLIATRSRSEVYDGHGRPPFIPGLHPDCYLPPRRDLEPVDWRPAETIPEDFYAM